jgi:hypothetical protein
LPSRARSGIASCFLVALLAASSASVLTPSVASAQRLSAQDEANARFQTGLKYYDNHDFESARLAFKQAYAVLQKPAILLNLALSELYSNHPLDAIVHFEEYMKDPSTPGDKRETAKKHLEEAMKKTSHLQIRTPAEAQVTIDGQSIPPPYTMVHVMPGAHAVEARLASKTKSTTIAPKPGDTVPIDLTFEGEPTPPPIALPTDPTATSNPPSATNNPPSGTEPSPGTAGASSSRMWWVVPAALGLAGLGGLGVGFVFASQQESSLEDADALRRGGPSNVCFDRASSQCRAYESKLDDASTQGTVSTIGYIGGGAFLVASAITAVLK